MGSLAGLVVVAATVLGQATTSTDEPLKALEPLIGNWVAEIPGFGKITESFTWTLNNRFIEHTLSMQGDDMPYTRKGIIGWDPSTKQIRQWAFSQSGSIRNFVWTKEGEKFTSKGTRIGSDGEKSEDQIIRTMAGRDTYVFGIEGQDVEMKRQPTKQ